MKFDVTNQKELKRRIASVMATRSSFIEIAGRRWKTPTLYAVEFKYKGFAYVVDIDENGDMTVARKVG